MTDSIAEVRGQFQIRHRRGGNGLRYYVWHPKTATIKHRAYDKLSCVEFIDTLEGLNYLVASHPWKQKPNPAKEVRSH